MAKRKRMSKEELKAPDEIEVVLNRVWENLNKYKNHIFIGIGALVALGVVLWLVNASSKSGALDRADAIRTAVAPFFGEVGERNPSLAELPGPKAELFEDEAARDKAALERLTAYAGEHESDDSRELVDLAIANLKVRTGDVAGAVTDVDGWLARYAESPVRAAALELKARALAAKGDRDAAAAAWQALATETSGDLKVEALRRAGDLYHPAFGSDAPDAAKARAAYEEALAVLGPAPNDPMAQFGVAGLRGEVNNRLDLLPQ